MTLSLRPAQPGDEAVITELIGALARYERLEHAVESTAGDMGAALFAPNPRVFCDLAEVDGAIVGFALWFYTFSTFRGRHGIYLEDLFVRPEARRAGAGAALLRGLARRCREEGLGRLEWSVLDWNAPAIDFYEAQGAQLLHDWIICRVEGPELVALARKAGA